MALEFFSRLAGTLNSYFHIGPRGVNGVRLKSNSGILEVKDSNDTLYQNMVAGGVDVNSGASLLHRLASDGSVILNEQGAAVVVRMETDTDANAFYLDGSTNNLGIGTAIPSAKLNVEGSVIINDGSADVDVRVESNNDANNLFSDGGSDNVGIGTGTPDASAKLHVVSTSKGAIAVPAMTAAQMAAITSPAEALMAYATDTDMVHVYDAQRFRNVMPIGWLPYAVPMGYSGAAGALGSVTLAANGGSAAIPIVLTGHMALRLVTIQQGSTATQRTWGWDLYIQYLNNGNGAENTLVRVAASNGSQTFTPTAIDNRQLAASGAPVYLGPGIYWLVVQNRHATNTLLIREDTTPWGPFNTNNVFQTKTTTNPNGATLDFVAATWTKLSTIPGVSLNGDVFGESSAF